MAQVIREEADGDNRYRIVRTEKGFLITARTRDQLGVLLPCEWLHRTEEAAQACLDAVMGMNALWVAVSHGYPTKALGERLDRLNDRHTRLCADLDDYPLIGQEVKELRQQADD